MTGTQGPWPGGPVGLPYAPAPPAPPAPRRRRSRWLTVGLPLGVLLSAGLVAAIVVAVHALSGALAPAQQAASSYARALVDGRWNDAQGQLCAHDRSTVTADALAQHYSSPALTGYRLDGINVSSVNGRSSGEARLVFTTADGLETATVLPLADDDGTWRPCP